MNCPLCNSKVVYAGLNTIECEGIGCKNQSRDICTFVAPTETKVGGWTLRRPPQWCTNPRCPGLICKGKEAGQVGRYWFAPTGLISPQDAIARYNAAQVKP